MSELYTVLILNYVYLMFSMFSISLENTDWKVIWIPRAKLWLYITIMSLVTHPPNL